MFSFFRDFLHFQRERKESPQSFFPLTECPCLPFVVYVDRVTEKKNPKTNPKKSSVFYSYAA